MAFTPLTVPAGAFAGATWVRTLHDCPLGYFSGARAATVDCALAAALDAQVPDSV